MSPNFKSKEDVRKFVWDTMVRRKIAIFPFPPHNRIPNFVGANIAAKRILDLEEYVSANVIKVNPDSPQRSFSEFALKDDKILLLATPRLKKGFLLLYPRIVKGKEKFASTIKGAFLFGKLIKNLDDLPRVDFILEGSVAVSLDCHRLGKGEGYAELEYAILRELNHIDKDIPIATTVHEVQIFESLPFDRYDVSIDIIRKN